MQGNFSGTEGAVILTCWFEKLESVFQVSKVADGNNVKYAACIMLYGALTWWNTYVRTIGIDAANAIPWSEFKLMLIKKYCPRRLSQNIKGNVTSSKPTDIHETITMAQILMDQAVLDLGVKIVDNKRIDPLPGQQIRETKTTRGTHLPAMLVVKKGIIRMSVQKQGTKAKESRSEATRMVETRTRTRTRETKMEEIMVRETRMETELILDYTG
ncbi:hypothetical protein Tco_0963492 [Tanacetum coccineum]